VAPLGASQTQQKGTGEIISDLWELIKAYGKQETVDPLKSIGRFLMWGLPGAVLLTLGLLFGSLAILRGLQTETDAHLSGSWDYVPHLAAFVFAVLAAGLSAAAITRPFKDDEAPR
jgi:hypothetical protein